MTLDTAVATLVATNGTGAISVTESNDITLANVQAGNGSITVTAGGQINASNVVSVTDNAANDISLTGNGIVAGTINAGNSGDVTLKAGTGAIETNGLGGKITADRLTAYAASNMTLDTAVATLVATNGTGAITVTEKDAITLESVMAGNGSVMVAAGSNMTVGTVLASGDTSNARLMTDAGNIVVNGSIAAGSNICVLSAAQVDINGNVTATNGSVAVWAKGGDLNQTAGTIQSVKGNVYLASTNNINQWAGAMVKADAGSVALSAHNALNLTGAVAAAKSLLMGASNIVVNGTLQANDTLGLEADGGSIVGNGQLIAKNMALKATGNIGVSDSARLHVNADSLGARTETGNIYLHEINGVASAVLGPLSVTDMLPSCASAMPVPAIGQVDGIHAGNILDLLVGGELSGDRAIESVGDMVVTAGALDLQALTAHGNAKLDIGGDVSIITAQVDKDLTLDADGSVVMKGLTVGGTATLTVGRDTAINTIDAGGAFDLQRGGGGFVFDALHAGSVQVRVGGSVAMGGVDAGTATFDCGSIRDNHSRLNVNTLVMRAGDKIGSEGSPINLNVHGTLSEVRGNNIYLLQNLGNLNVGTITAGNDLHLGVPHGYILDANGEGMNITAKEATFDAEKIGERANPLEVDIGGTIAVRNSSWHPSPTENYIWVHISNTHDGNLQKGKVDVDYSGNVPGLVIQNNQVVGGQDKVMRAIFRTEAFYVDTPELKSKQGVFGSPYFLHSLMQINEPVALGLIDYILYGQAKVTFDPVLNTPSESFNKGGNKAKGGESAKQTPKKSDLKDKVASL